MGMFSFISADSGNPGHGANPPPPPPTPVSSAPLRAGVYLRPWTENPTTIGALPDLRPGVIRINYPAFSLMTHNIDPPEAGRLVGLIETQIVYARSLGALPLIVTTLADIAPASELDVLNSAQNVAEYYASVAVRYPGLTWEIGNEAEIMSGGKDAALTPQTYAAVFQIHADVIRAADPTAKLVTAGTSGFANAWIRDVLALTTPDAVGVHPYGVAPRDYAKAVADLGTKLPVYFTEWGLQNISPQQVTDFYAYARGVVPVAVLFCLSDLSAEAGQTFGLIDSHGNRRVSYAAAKASFALTASTT